MKRIFSESKAREKELRRENLQDVLRSIKKEDDFRRVLFEYCSNGREHQQTCTENRSMILEYMSKRFNNTKHLTILALVEPEKFIKALKLQNKGGLIRYYYYSNYSEDYGTVYLDTLNPHYDKQLLEVQLKTDPEINAGSYRVTLDIPYPGLIPPPDTPGKVEGLIYEINFGNGVFRSSA